MNPVITPLSVCLLMPQVDFAVGFVGVEVFMTTDLCVYLLVRRNYTVQALGLGSADFGTKSYRIGSNYYL